MKRASIRVQEPTPELIEKIRRARVAISQQKPRYLKCPYCQHNALAVLRSPEVVIERDRGLRDFHCSSFPLHGSSGKGEDRKRAA